MPVVQSSHGQKKGHGKQQKSVPTMVRGAGIALRPWAGAGVLGPPRCQAAIPPPLGEPKPDFSRSFSIYLQRGFLHVG